MKPGFSASKLKQPHQPSRTHLYRLYCSSRASQRCC